jgi:xanthine dehydrogenase YagR molybdenum-binding subunit
VGQTKIGSDVQRVDGRDKVMGHAIFGADRQLARMAFAVPKAATIGKGRIRNIDTRAAERRPGVLLILTHVNMDRLKPIIFSFAGGQAIQSLQPMQTPAIAYRGQAIALVVAESLEIATDAAALVRVDYDETPFAVELDSPGVETVKQAVAAPYFPDFVRGDPNPILHDAPVGISQTYYSAPQHQNPMELLSTVAEWRGDELIVHEGTQAAQAMKQGLAIQLDIPPEKVRVISPYVGGGFGQRGSISPHTTFAAVAARRLQLPVKLVVPRAQVFHATSFRAATEHNIRLAADQDGRLLAGAHEVRAQTSQFDLMPFTGQETTSRMYAWPAFHGATTLVKLDTQTPGFMRAPQEMGSFFALESAMDELSYALDLDPVELRLRNDATHDPISGKPFTLRRLSDCLKRGAQRFGWARRIPTPGSMRSENGELIGWGVAAGAYPGYISPALAKIRLDAQGFVYITVGGHEMGQGIRTAIVVVAADALGVDPSVVRLTIGDTAAPPQHTTAGSWGSATATPPILEAASVLRLRLARLATARSDGPLFGLEVGQITLTDGQLLAPNGVRERITDTLRAANLPYIEAEAQSRAPGLKSDALKDAAVGKIAFAGPEFPDYVNFSFIAHFAEVRIDPRIPRPRVSRFVSVVDCGKVISRRTAHSQILGGIVWGVGAALSEASEVDPQFGGFLNSNIAEYQVPVNADIPVCEIDFIDEADPVFNSVGAKGVGEVACVGANAAIANAVFHATGKRVRHLPIRIEDLMS